MGCESVLTGEEFSREEIRRCLESNRLLTMELEFSPRCNLNCAYCYNDSRGNNSLEGLGFKTLKDIVLQARGLGAKRVILLGGGEPLLYRYLKETIGFIHQQGLKQTLISNGTCLDKPTARFLFKHRVAVVVKRNSFIPKVQDSLAGQKGAYAGIERAIALLEECGYPSLSAPLGIQTIICRQNYKEIPTLWRWARLKNISPYVETLTLQGEARRHPRLYLPPGEIKKLFDELCRIDRQEFGREWLPHPPIAAGSCRRHLYTCLVNYKGDVLPCVGIRIVVGNIYRRGLKEILGSSPVIRKLRRIWEHIKGPCKECLFKYRCYGCRGNAYQLTGDYLAADPYCWLSGDNRCLANKKPGLKGSSGRG